VPTSQGERVVFRLLDKTARLYRLDEIGLSEENMAEMRRLINYSHGIILITGPTGSGKTTTLYAALAEINSDEKNVITIEDPIEYNIDGISQIQVSNKKGLTFASGLRSLMRQDPDVMMVGEIRDEETASTAIQAALTGHVVLSTLHTNDASSTITRLVDMGVEAYLIAAALNMILAQRLVRRVCVQCRQEYEPPRMLRKAIERMGMEVDAYYKGVGCRKCRNTGFKGRIGIHELLSVTDEVRDAIVREVPIGELRRLAAEGGMVTIRQDGLRKVREAITTIEEVLHATGGI
jgi:type II secretory ATPase GspE/PulE/Tfp pilus assembly ATPase PilB-like protein